MRFSMILSFLCQRFIYFATQYSLAFSLIWRSSIIIERTAWLRSLYFGNTLRTFIYCDCTQGHTYYEYWVAGLRCSLIYFYRRLHFLSWAWCRYINISFICLMIIFIDFELHWLLSLTRTVSPSFASASSSEGALDFLILYFYYF